MAIQVIEQTAAADLCWFLADFFTVCFNKYWYKVFMKNLQWWGKPPYSWCKDSLFPASFSCSSHLNLIMPFQSVRSCVQRASSARHFCGLAPQAPAQWSLIPPGALCPGGLNKCPPRSGRGPPQCLSEHVWLWKITTILSLSFCNAQLTNVGVLTTMTHWFMLSCFCAFLSSSEYFFPVAKTMTTSLKGQYRVLPYIFSFLSNN